MTIYAPAFEALWKLYPRKMGKRAALLAWGRACKREDLSVIHSGLEQRLSYLTGLDPRFCPHLATWLNQERWLDEVPGAVNGHAATSQELRLHARSLMQWKLPIARAWAKVWVQEIPEMIAKGYLTAERMAELEDQ